MEAPARIELTACRVETGRSVRVSYGAILVRAGRFELPACRLGNDRSVLVSYARVRRTGTCPRFSRRPPAAGAWRVP